MNGYALLVTGIASLCAAFLVATLVWSILVPTHRLWPPSRVTLLTQLMVWPPTVAIFVAVILVGIAEWNVLEWPDWLRFGIGLPLILAGNVIVWRAAFGIGMGATSGARDELKTSGPYRWSRNPQYVADMGILFGWGTLFGSPSAWIIAAGGIAVLAIAPFAEEPWLEKVYGDAYRRYCNHTPRFLGLARS